MADACIHVMNLADDKLKAIIPSQKPLVNIGTGKDVTIAELAQTIKDIVGFGGEIVYDSEKPDGTPKKLLDVGRLKRLGWSAKFSLKEGIEKTYGWFLDNFR